MLGFLSCCLKTVPTIQATGEERKHLSELLSNLSVAINKQKLTIFTGFTQLLQDARFPLLLLEDSANNEQVLLLLTCAHLVLVLPQVREVFHLRFFLQVDYFFCFISPGYHCRDSSWRQQLSEAAWLQALPHIPGIFCSSPSLLT